MLMAKMFWRWWDSPCFFFIVAVVIAVAVQLLGHSEDILAICGSRMYVFFLDAAPTERLLSQIGSLLTFLDEEEDMGDSEEEADPPANTAPSRLIAAALIRRRTRRRRRRLYA